MELPLPVPEHTKKLAGAADKGGSTRMHVDPSVPRWTEQVQHEALRSVARPYMNEREWLLKDARWKP